MLKPILFAAAMLGSSALYGQSNGALKACDVEILVLGTSQDGGTPQLGNWADPAWRDRDQARKVVSLGLVDHRTSERWLFEATPDIRAQLYALNQHRAGMQGPKRGHGLSGIFLTHAHIGHYTGLMFLGHESMGAQGVPVHVFPRFAEYLTTNGPWSQLVAYKNIKLSELSETEPVPLSDGLSVEGFLVPHRQEYAEVAGFRIKGPARSALFIPDIDSWHEWDAAGTRIEDQITSVDYAFIDATFFDNGEIPGRDMSGFPHPFVRHSMDRFGPLTTTEKAKVHFIHFNHTNPIRSSESAESQEVADRGFNIAREGTPYCLSD